MNQAELTLSLIIFKRDIRRVICKKGKQLEHPIHKITIIEYPTCGKMVEENKDHYCPPARETDPTILTNKSWWDTTHSGPQTPLELTEEWYPEFQDGYETLPQQEAQHHKHINKDHNHQQKQKMMIKSQNGTQKWMIMMKNLKSITKNIE